MCTILTRQYLQNRPLRRQFSYLDVLFFTLWIFLSLLWVTISKFFVFIFVCLSLVLQEQRDHFYCSHKLTDNVYYIFYANHKNIECRKQKVTDWKKFPQLTRLTVVRFESILFPINLSARYNQYRIYWCYYYFSFLFIILYVTNTIFLSLHYYKNAVNQ